MLNERVLATLPNAGETVLGSSINAQLIEWAEGELEAETSILWEFLYNPEIIQYSVRARYAEIAGLGQRVPHQQYQHSDGLSLTITNLRLDGWWRGKIVQPLADGLIALTKASEDQHPPILSFVLAGRTVIAPCVLTQVSISESAWAASGQATVATADLTFQEVHRDSIDIQSQITVPELANTADGRPILPLTERQQSEGEGEATDWLTSNLNSLTALTRSVFDTQDYSFSVDSTLGDVTLLDAAQGILGKVGRWDGRNFKAYSELLDQS